MDNFFSDWLDNNLDDCAVKNACLYEYLFYDIKTETEKKRKTKK